VHDLSAEQVLSRGDKEIKLGVCVDERNKQTGDEAMTDE
jgi:hypothetical protein